MDFKAFSKPPVIPGKVPLAAFARCISRAVDYIAPKLSNHHNKVCRIALEIGRNYGLSNTDLLNSAVAALLHDAGGLSLKMRLEALEFNTDGRHHAELGYRLLRGWQALEEPARLVRGHHCRYDEYGPDIALGCHLLHLADRVDTLINPNQFILDQVPDISSKIIQHSGGMFHPDLVSAFIEVADRDYFWLETAASDLDEILVERLAGLGEPLDFSLDLDQLLGFSSLVAHLIDFRSRFTATHSSGVAACAGALGVLCGFSEDVCKLLQVSGFLHDLGKLAVPAEILEKPGKLTWTESNRMRTHSYYTGSILRAVPQLESVTIWACLHHERPGGLGYPFQLSGEDIPPEARILAVADVFTALLEDRPYRQGMQPAEAKKVLSNMADNNQLDPEATRLLLDNFTEIDATRFKSQRTARQNYNEFMQ